MGAIRPPAVAGAFYPAQPARLRTMVRDFVAEAGGGQADPPPKAIIAPHAGYIYSGPVAARAFAALDRERAPIRRVIVIGPVHFVPIRGLAVPEVDAFRTPLGVVPLDRTAIDEILDLPRVQVSDPPHEPEHALEVELPFLQTVLGEFSLVPLVVGNARPEEVAEVLERLWGGDDTLIVVSSDLSHYHPYETAQRLDGATAAAIERFDDTRLGPSDACGYLPIAGLLVEARRRDLRVERLDLRNSGDTAGSRDSVVGYGAWAFFEPTP
jgi:AmmeMemoRadiSam system protein B